MSTDLVQSRDIYQRGRLTNENERFEYRTIQLELKNDDQIDRVGATRQYASTCTARTASQENPKKRFAGMLKRIR
ncbi:hypothetical protein BHYA_0112g00300 [Botrytis hyacinthi]|uniref:Uncharacterized protein n=1 Tax=Botrytis hyacinthi TaxID=278943 RepID=A0A4Z1GQF8_9HELO|nr:hypothetical protein BHYA_0112g00300 [Botrytis hyacinthi]